MAARLSECAQTWRSVQVMREPPQDRGQVERSRGSDGGWGEAMWPWHLRHRGAACPTRPPVWDLGQQRLHTGSMGVALPGLKNGTNLYMKIQIFFLLEKKPQPAVATQDTFPPGTGSSSKPGRGAPAAIDRASPCCPVSCLHGPFL